MITIQLHKCPAGASLEMPEETVKFSEKKACISCNGEYSADLIECPVDGTVLTSLVENSLVGTTLDDRYEILDIIGGGGMGMVYRARQKFIDRTVAVKVLNRGSITGADTLKRFRLEAQAASALSSPHIVTVFDCNVSRNGEPYMVMDYLDGPSLQSVLDEEERLAPGRVLNILIQAAEALAKAHSKGIVHRDVKPSNIVLVHEDDNADFVKIVDFGIAKIVKDNEAGAAALTRTGEIFGSPLYMSPEQWRGGKLDARTDIYSLGAVMYRAIYGRPMFETADVMQLAYKHTHEMPLPMEIPGVHFPAGLGSVVLKAVEKNADDRFQTMQEFSLALVELKKQLALIVNQMVVPNVVPVEQINQSANFPSGNLPSPSITPESDSARRAMSTGTQEWLRDLSPAPASVSGFVDVEATLESAVRPVGEPAVTPAGEPAVPPVLVSTNSINSKNGTKIAVATVVTVLVGALAFALGQFGSQTRTPVEGSSSASMAEDSKRPPMPPAPPRGSLLEPESPLPPAHPESSSVLSTRPVPPSQTVRPSIPHSTTPTAAPTGVSVAKPISTTHVVKETKKPSPHHVSPRERRVATRRSGIKRAFEKIIRKF